MPRSFLSRPAVQRFLSAPGPLVFYSPLAIALAWGAWHSGWLTTSSVLCAGLCVLFSGIVVQEVRWCLTGHHPP